MKQSIDYFPHYTQFSSKELDLRYDYGATGIGLYYAILNDIYGFEGYYVEITSTYIKRLTTENNITNENGQRDVKTTMKIMGQMLKSGLFDMNLYKKYKIFTSIEIQRNYFKVAERRVGSEIIEQYILPFSYEKLKNVNRNEENVNNVGKNVSEKIQSKVKVDNSKVYKETSLIERSKESKETADEPPCLSAIENFKKQTNKYVANVTEIPLGIDMELLTKKVLESDWLMQAQNMNLKQCLKHYDEIINGNYANDKKKQSNYQSKNNDTVITHNYTEEQCKDFFTDLDNVEL